MNADRTCPLDCFCSPLLKEFLLKEFLLQDFE